MTAYGIVIGSLLAFPWALVGVALLGAASSAVGRWLGRRRRALRVRRGGRRVHRPTNAVSDQDRMRLSSVDPSVGRTQRSPTIGSRIEERRAA